MPEHKPSLNAGRPGDKRRVRWSHLLYLRKKNERGEWVLAATGGGLALLALVIAMIALLVLWRPQLFVEHPAGEQRLLSGPVSG